MKLCAIFLCWADWDWLEYSVENIKPHVDGVIVLGATSSNYGEVFHVPRKWVIKNTNSYQFHFINSNKGQTPRAKETEDRNAGLYYARESGFTHFIMLDSDEFYDPIEFRKAKDYLNSKPNLNGLVVESQVYFKSPTLTIGKDITLVPHIHKLTPTIRHEFNKNYPFAWSGKQIRIDPTRSLNISSGVEMFDCMLHHYSWCRKDYSKKIRNSTARANLERSTIMQDLLHAKEGYYCEFYQKHLVRVPNRFGIPDYGVFSDKDLQSGGSPVSPGNEAN